MRTLVTWLKVKSSLCRCFISLLKLLHLCQFSVSADPLDRRSAELKWCMIILNETWIPLQRWRVGGCFGVWVWICLISVLFFYVRPTWHHAAASQCQISKDPHHKQTNTQTEQYVQLQPVVLFNFPSGVGKKFSEIRKFKKTYKSPRVLKPEPSPWLGSQNLPHNRFMSSHIHVSAQLCDASCHFLRV